MSSPRPLIMHTWFLRSTIIKQALNERKGVIHINGEIESSDQVNDEWFKSLILEELGAKGTCCRLKNFLKSSLKNVGIVSL